MDWTLEVIVVPVSDIARSIGFYRDKLGFVQDFETAATSPSLTSATAALSLDLMTRTAIPGLCSRSRHAPTSR